MTRERERVRLAPSCLRRRLRPLAAACSALVATLAVAGALSSSPDAMAAGTIGSSGKAAAADLTRQEFPYTGGVQPFVAPYTGEYVLEAWGASGGGKTAKTEPSHSGTGGYTRATISLTAGQTLYVIVGGAGTLSNGAAGGYNGGGNGLSTGAGGGGMTHISTTNNPVPAAKTESWSTAGTLIVAGGGGGSDDQLTSETKGGSNDGSGGDGGGRVAGNATRDGTPVPNSVAFHDAIAQNDSGCGRGGTWTQGYRQGRGEESPHPTDVGGGGGGWWGGCTTAYNNGGAGGGSGWYDETRVTGGVTLMRDETDPATGTAFAGQVGNGKARITLANELIIDLNDDDPNGSNETHPAWWDDGSGIPTSGDRSFRRLSGSMRIADPTREGYRFVGWAEVGSGKLDNIFQTNGDGAFSSSDNTILIYNNNLNGAVAHDVIDVPGMTPYGTKALHISHSPTLESKPQLGGFYYGKLVTASQRYLMVFSAKVPAGFYLQWATNPLGEGGHIDWLTDRKGTGDWRTYAYLITSGTAEPFRTMGHVFMTRNPESEWPEAGADPAAEDVSWDVAYSELYNITSGYTFTFRSDVPSSSRLIAQWEPLSYRVHYHYGNDDDYKAGQYDTLGMSLDYDKDVLLTGTVRTDAGTDATLFDVSGASPVRTSVSGGHLTVSSGASSSSATGSVSAGSPVSFSARWDEASQELYLTTDDTADMTVRRAFPSLSGQSAGEIAVGSGNAGAGGATTEFPPVHVSDVILRTVYEKGESFSLPHPTRIGYRFLGWDTKEDGTGTRYAANQIMTDLASEGDTHLYAQWELRSYVVSFDANGGAGAMPSQDFMWNEEKALSHCSMLRFNWKFTGWNTEPDGSGTAYTDDEVVRNLLEKPVVTENDYRITLYAQWEKVSNTSQIEDGLWEIRVPAWGKVSVSNLPAGASFEVVEQPQQDWVLTSQENTSGTIVPRVTEVAKFQNEYRPNETSLALAATKTLDGVSPVGSDFSFTLSGADEQTTAKIASGLDGSETETVSNNGGGIQFSPVVYNRDDIGKTFTYLIQEVEGDDQTIAYTTVTKTVTVNVTTGATGLVATAEYPDLEGQTAIFANRTKPGSLRVTKEVVGGTDAAREKNLFPVTVALSDSLGTPISGSYEVTRNGITVMDAEFDEEGTTTVSVADGDELVVSGIPAGTRYSVTESYPEWFRQAEAEGTDGVIQPDTRSQASFANEYLVSGKAEVKARKTLLGAPLSDDEFSFRLLDEDGSVIATATNDADGTVAFPPMEYGAEDDGSTYEYIVAEDDDGREDIAYDDSQRHVTVTVADEDGTGELDVKVLYEGEEALFENEKLTELATTGKGGTGTLLGVAAASLAVAAAALVRRKGHGSWPRESS